MESNKIDLSSLDLNEMEELFLELGEKKFRATQFFEWLNKKLINNIDEATNISLELRNKLKSIGYISEMEIIEKNTSENQDSTKYLFKIEGNNIIESVLMRYSFGNSICVSTQVGCRMDCSFCASTINGLERNLTTGEILRQVYKVQKDIGERISNIVLMGSGEPLDNFDNVIKFMQIINDEKGLNIGERHITLSTCGLVRKIYDLANLKMQITLAVSLHAPNDEIRQQIMPIAKSTKMPSLLEACNYYGNKTKRRVTYEYSLIKNVNDSLENAKELGKKIKNTLCHVNLITINEIEEKSFKQSDSKTVENFASALRNFGIETTIRRKLGSSINASCGQLRNRKLEE